MEMVAGFGHGPGTKWLNFQVYPHHVSDPPAIGGLGKGCKAPDIITVLLYFSCSRRLQ